MWLKNSRLIKNIKFKKLVKSIEDLPSMLQLRPIVVDEDMVILGGNMRYKACIEAGLKEIPIIVADELNEDEKKAFVIKDNVSYGEWDWDILANDWDVKELEEWGLDGFPFEDVNEETNNKKEKEINICDDCGKNII